MTPARTLRSLGHVDGDRGPFSAVARAQADATGDVVTFTWFDERARKVTTCVTAPAREPVHVITPDGELTGARVVNAVRRYVGFSMFNQAHILIAAARESMALADLIVTELDYFTRYMDENPVCNHGRRCCPVHGDHSSPHKGCVLR